MSYNNLPSAVTSSDMTASSLNNYYSKTFDLHAGTLNLMKGFFESKGFNSVPAEQLSVTIMKQAQQDGYNPLTILDSLKKLDNLELNSTISEIVNYNRFKTSFIGYSSKFVSYEPIARNIVA